MDEKLVAIKMINPDCAKNFAAFKRVRFSPPPPQKKKISSVSFSVLVLTETLHEWGYMETTTAPERGRLPWVRRQRPSFFPCIHLDVQRELA